MPRGRRRKIEVPTYTQPQFELEDTAEDIETRRRKSKEREERARREQEERDRERIERERMEESEERTEKRPRTDTDTDVESTQSRQKKGQMKFIFLSDSDEEAIVEFIKHKELYDKTHSKFKDKQRKEGLWERLAASRNLSVNTVKKWFKTQCTRYGKVTQTKSGQAAAKNTERHTWLKNSFRFLRGHIRRKGVLRSSMINSPLRPSAAAATASVPDTSRETESEMLISMTSDVTHQPSTTSPS